MATAPPYSYGSPPPKEGSKTLLYLGIGCLGLIIVGVIAVVATVGGGIYMLANSEAATAAKAFVEANGVVRNELGEPVTTSFAGGVINTSSGVNTATIEVNATGPRGSGKATVELRSRGSEPWVVTSGRLEGGPSGSVRLEPPG